MIRCVVSKSRDAHRSSRRLFLRGAGGTLLALPLLTSLWPRRGMAEVEDDAVGLITFYQGCGVGQSKWWPEASFGPIDASAFPDDHSFAPIADYADRLLFVRGLDNVPHLGGCDHHRVMASILSAHPHQADQGGNAGGADSVDSVISRYWDPAQRPPLVLFAGNPNGSKYKSATHVAGEPVFGITTPAEAFSQVVGIFPDEDASAQIQAQKARGKSVLDLAHSELCSLRTQKLSSADQKKLDAYTEALRGVELDLEGGSTTCQKPTEDYSALDSVPSDTAGKIDYAKRLVDIGVLATVCGFRRSTTFYMGGEAPGTVWDFLGATCDHHGLSHHTCDGNSGGPFQESSDAIMRNIDRFHVEGLFKRALDRLAELDGEGPDALSRTGVLLLSGLSDGRTHSHKNIPIVLAGGMGGYFKQGHYIETTPSGFSNETLCDSSSCNPHNRFLLMLARAAGVDIETFGPDTLPTGEHPELRA